MNWTNVYAAINDEEVIVYSNIENCKIYMNGKKVDLDQSSDKITSIEEIIKRIEYLYDDYKNSVPREMDADSKYFKAKPYKDLTLSDLVNGDDRYRARQKLESFIVFVKMFRKEDILAWFGDRFFWQSKKDPELILLKSWFE